MGNKLSRQEIINIITRGEVVYYKGRPITSLADPDLPVSDAQILQDYPNWSINPANYLSANAVGIDGFPISGTPTNGQTLSFNNTSKTWEYSSVAGLTPLSYQIVQSANASVSQRSNLKFDDSFSVIDSAGANSTVITSLSTDWINIKSPTYNASGSVSTSIGSIPSGSTSLSVNSATGWAIGNGVRIIGAGTSGTDLITSITNISGTTFTLANPAMTTVNGVIVAHDDTAAIQSAINDGLSNDKTVYLPSGTFYVSTLSLISPNSLHLLGAGPGCTTLRSISNSPIILIDTLGSTAHSITIENISFIGSGAAATIQPNNYGIRFKDTGSMGLFGLTIRNCRFNDFDNSAIKVEKGVHTVFTVLLEGIDVSQPSDAIGNAIDLWGSNDNTLIRCYVHSVATGKAAYRVRSGSSTFIGCNGIDGGSGASWGVFGNIASEDGELLGSVVVDSTNNTINLNSHGLTNGTAVVFDASTSPGNITLGNIYYVRDVESNSFKIASTLNGLAVDITSNGAAVTCRTAIDSYCRVTLIGCNIESFSQYGIRCKVGSSASFFNSQLIGPSAGIVTPIKFDYVDENQAGIFDGLSRVQTQGATYVNGFAVHSFGLPFIQLGHRQFTHFYDTNGEAAATFPSITGTRITGSQHFALTHAGYHKISGHLALEEQGSPVSAPSNTGFLYAKDSNGATGLYWKSDGINEKRIDTASTGLTSTRVAFGSSENILTDSGNLVYDDTNKILTISKAGGNPYLFVTDTSNTIDLRVGTLAGAPDRGIIGTMTDDQFVLYQNGNEAWGIGSDKHWRPFTGDTVSDIGTTSAKVRDIRIGRDIHSGRQIQSSGNIVSHTFGTGAGTSPSVTIRGNSIAGAITLTTGANPASSSKIIELTVASAFTSAPIVVITTANSNAADLSGSKQVFIDDSVVTATKFTLKSGATALSAETEYRWYFHIIGI